MQHVIMPRHLCLAVIIICQSLHSCENLWPDPELVVVGGAPSTLQPVLTGTQRGSLIASAVSSGPETKKLGSTDSVVYNSSIFFPFYPCVVPMVFVAVRDGELWIWGRWPGKLECLKRIIFHGVSEAPGLRAAAYRMSMGLPWELFGLRV